MRWWADSYGVAAHRVRDAGWTGHRFEKRVEREMRKAWYNHEQSCGELGRQWAHTLFQVMGMVGTTGTAGTQLSLQRTVLLLLLLDSL